jgi:hypothetical protein
MYSECIFKASKIYAGNWRIGNSKMNKTQPLASRSCTWCHAETSQLESSIMPSASNKDHYKVFLSPLTKLFIKDSEQLQKSTKSNSIRFRAGWEVLIPLIQVFIISRALKLLFPHCNKCRSSEQNYKVNS